MILDTFTIVANDEREQWEFIPKVASYTSHAIPYSECNNKADACIAVWNALQAGRGRKQITPPRKDDLRLVKTLILLFAPVVTTAFLVFGTPDNNH